MRMLYRVPGPHLLDGILCEYCVVPDTEQAVSEAARDGWQRSPTEAKAWVPVVAEPEPVVEHVPVSEPTREDLVQLAESLGIKVDGRWSVARIRQAIDAADDEAS